jgi:hypothetical protein
VEKIAEGFMTLGYYNGIKLIRFVIGNYNSDLKTIIIITKKSGGTT